MIYTLIYWRALCLWLFIKRLSNHCVKWDLAIIDQNVNNKDWIGLIHHCSSTSCIAIQYFQEEHLLPYISLHSSKILTIQQGQPRGVSSIGNPRQASTGNYSGNLMAEILDLPTEVFLIKCARVWQNAEVAWFTLLYCQNFLRVYNYQMVTWNLGTLEPHVFFNKLYSLPLFIPLVTLWHCIDPYIFPKSLPICLSQP